MSNPTTSRKSLKSFNVRDGLWKLFEVRAAEMDCSVDYLINEAMRLYARTHNFAASVRVEGQLSTTGVTTAPGVTGSDPGVPRPGGVAPVRPSMAPVPHPTVPRAPAPPPPSPPIPGPQTGQHPMSNTGASIPRPTAPSYETTGGAHQAMPHLTLIFQGRKFPITTGQFIIGRGSKSSDLAIKDPNISRKHAAVIFHNGAFYIKDLGSTNGVEYKGKTVDSKRIDEGDVFSICGYDLHFTYSV